MIFKKCKINQNKERCVFKRDGARMTNQNIVEHKFNTASELWKAISPERYIFDIHESTIFRGQGDSNWQLRPSMLREGNHPIESIPEMKSSRRLDKIIYSEMRYFQSFVQYCDSVGLELPEDSVRFRKEYLNFNSKKSIDMYTSHIQEWPPYEFYGLMAIAQHYKLPTRLLDWSRRSYVAAYFAAVDALFGQDSQRLAIWVLDISSKEKMKSLEIIEVPGSNNVNISAQRGILTLLRQDYNQGESFSGSECLDEYVASVQPCSICKLTLPVSEAPKLFHLCGLNSITEATLFPDFYGAARATLVDMSRWKKASNHRGTEINIRKLKSELPQEG
ncbi:MAG: FRG domain-containing protein [Terracidiphilus sp.]|nr:FRG domain-containing protein [Terracidiphilus sp.]